MISVFEYLDYRKFLADYYRYKKSQSKYFSYRLLVDKAGISSTGYISEVINGIRNLTRTKIPKIGKALSLSERELEYLEALVEFNHAKTQASKQIAYGNLLNALPPKAQRLKQSQLEYFSKWYYVAVRESLAIYDMRENYEELARLLRPNILPSQVKAALKLLESLRLINKDAAGRWRATHSTVLSQTDESAAFMVRSFQGEMIDLAKHALQTVPKEERDITTNTMSVSPAGLERVKGILKECHKRILEVVQADKAEDRVFQLNLQLFPITYPQGEAHET